MILLFFMRQPFYSSAMVSSLYDGIFSYVRVPPDRVNFYEYLEKDYSEADSC